MKYPKLVPALCVIAVFITAARLVYFSAWSNLPFGIEGPSESLNRSPQTARSFQPKHSPALQDSAKLNNGVLMPLIGFGTAGLGGNSLQAVQSALDIGFRHIDTAQAREWYREDLVGAALATWLKDNGIPRENLFLTTKIHPRHFGRTTTLDVFANSLSDLHTMYLDLVLLHYPYCWGNLCGSIQPEGSWRDAWRALEDLHTAGKARAIGVSNFNTAEMRKLLEHAEVMPQVLQIHIDPLAQNRQLMKFSQEEGIQVEAYSSLGTQWGLVGPDHHNPVLSHPVLQEIARELNRTVAQVVLRWLLQLKVAVIPRSTNATHQREALLGVKEFELQPRHMEAISALDGTLPK